jgi:hypothetical protein
VRTTRTRRLTTAIHGVRRLIAILSPATAAAVVVVVDFVVVEWGEGASP